MKYGYARVSTEEQNTDLQRDALKAAGCEKIIIEKVSGTSACASSNDLEHGADLVIGGSGSLFDIKPLGADVAHLCRWNKLG